MCKVLEVESKVQFFVSLSRLQVGIRFIVVAEDILRFILEDAAKDSKYSEKYEDKYQEYLENLSKKKYLLGLSYIPVDENGVPTTSEKKIVENGKDIEEVLRILLRASNISDTPREFFKQAIKLT